MSGYMLPRGNILLLFGMIVAPPLLFGGTVCLAYQVSRFMGWTP